MNVILIEKKDTREESRYYRLTTISLILRKIEYTYIYKTIHKKNALWIIVWNYSHPPVCAWGPRELVPHLEAFILIISYFNSYFSPITFTVIRGNGLKNPFYLHLLFFLSSLHPNPLWLICHLWGARVTYPGHHHRNDVPGGIVLIMCFEVYKRRTALVSRISESSDNSQIVSK